MTAVVVRQSRVGVAVDRQEDESCWGY
jgi:hypothetical protein